MRLNPEIHQQLFICRSNCTHRLFRQPPSSSRTSQNMNLHPKTSLSGKHQRLGLSSHPLNKAVQRHQQYQVFCVFQQTWWENPTFFRLGAPQSPAIGSLAGIRIRRILRQGRPEEQTPAVEPTWEKLFWGWKVVGVEQNCSLDNLDFKDLLKG